LKVAIVHSYYSSSTPSGENAMVQEQADALAEAGMEVIVISKDTDTEQAKSLYSLRAAARTLTGIGASPGQQLQDFQPDIVHVHNLFPNFGTSWTESWRDRIVTTLHNFRPICANGLLFRDGRKCLECPEGDPLAALRHRCYHSSWLATVPLAVRNRRGVDANPLLANSRRIVLLSSTAMDLYSRYGLDTSTCRVIPNGLANRIKGSTRASNGRWLYVGRLSPEKGIVDLVRGWPVGESLDVIGDGEQASTLRDLSTQNIRLKGSAPRDEVRDCMGQYEGLIFPSGCFEMQPTTVIEAMAASIPIVALSSSAGAELVKNFHCGVVYGNGRNLESALSEARSNRDALGHMGRKAYEDYFTRAAWVDSITRLYREVASESEGQ
jgi:glycosyltransferase involved in cell wall biosynthesis